MWAEKGVDVIAAVAAGSSLVGVAAASIAGYRAERQREAAREASQVALTAAEEAFEDALRQGNADSLERFLRSGANEEGEGASQPSSGQPPSDQDEGPRVSYGPDAGAAEGDGWRYVRLKGGGRVHQAGRETPLSRGDLALPKLWGITHRRLNYYHDIATDQAKRSFRNAQLASGPGFALLVAFVFVALNASTTTGSIVAGGLGAVSAKKIDVTLPALSRATPRREEDSRVPMTSPSATRGATLRPSTAAVTARAAAA